MGISRRNKLTARQLHEKERQVADPKRKLHAAAYKFILEYWRHKGKVPGSVILNEWIDDMGLSVRPCKLIEGMIDSGWLKVHGKGYALKTQIDKDSIIEGLITAYENRNDKLFHELCQLWRADKGRANAKARKRQKVD